MTLSDIRFKKYLTLLESWNRKLNLTAVAARDRQKELIDKSLLFLPHIAGETLLDIGSGAGIPGIVLKIAKPELRVWLCESNRKKSHFLEEAIIELELKDIRVLAKNFHELDYAGFFDIIVSRALGEKPMEKSLFLLKPDGKSVYYRPGDSAIPGWTRRGDFLIWQK